MKISIIIPVFNCEKYIEKCLSSIVNQNVDMEIILIDDHSTDKSCDLCKKLQKKYKQVKLFTNPKKGTTSGRNEGLRNVTGDIVTFCDQDDYFELDCFEKVIKEFEENKIDILVTAFNFVEKDKTTYRGFLNKQFMSTKELIPHVINDQKVTGCVWTKFFKKEVLENIYFEEDLWYAEDITFNCKVLSDNKDAKCLVTNFATYNYVDNPQNLTNNIDRRFDNKDNLYYINCFKRIREICDLDEKLNDEVGYKIVWYAIDYTRCMNPQGNRRKILQNEIKENIHCLFKLFFKYGFVNNLKKLLWICYEFIFGKVYKRKGRYEHNK